MAKRCPAKDPTRPLNRQQKLFVEEYLVDLNATAAATRAGYSAKCASEIGLRLLRQPNVQAAIAVAMDARSARVEITADAVLQRWWQIATADPNALVQFRRQACRYCHGEGHAYQWIDGAEFDASVAKASAHSGTLPKNDGGFGFVPNADPSPDCPRCGGEGIGSLFAADTRRLKGSARLLYAGAKETRDGLEIKTHDQAKALENVAKHLGMFTERVEHSGKIDFEKMSEEQLLAEIAAYRPDGT